MGRPRIHFDDYTFLSPNERVTYEATRNPVARCGGVSFANEEVTLHAGRGGEKVKVFIFWPVKCVGVLRIVREQQEIVMQSFAACPNNPFEGESAAVGSEKAPLTIHIMDKRSTLLADHTF